MKTLEFVSEGERFLPFRPATLLERLLKDPRLTPHERDQFQFLNEMIAVRFHFEFHHKAERLHRLYDPFDPDRDTLPTDAPPTATLQGQRVELYEAFRKLLLEGNYFELPRRQIVEYVELQNYGGLKVEVNLDDYADLAVFYRGVVRGERCLRSWRRAWRKQAKECTVFRRAALLVRTIKQDDCIHLKLFKDIVAEDLEMILPRVRVRMHWVDGLKIGSSVAGSVATAAWKAFTTALLSPWLFLIMLCTFLFAMIRAFFAYITSRTRYMQALSANLYFQNIANNASALSCLVHAAEAEETKELLLAYFILYTERDRNHTKQSLARRVSQWVRDEFGAEIDFESGNVAGKLIEMGLAVERMAPGDSQGQGETPSGDEPSPPCRRVLKVYDIPSALRRLDHSWDDFYSYNADQAPQDDRLADGTVCLP